MSVVYGGILIWVICNLVLLALLIWRRVLVQPSRGRGWNRRTCVLSTSSFALRFAAEETAALEN
jgi:hypothetical protein